MMVPLPTGIALASDPNRPFDSAIAIARARPCPERRPNRAAVNGHVPPNALDGES